MLALNFFCINGNSMNLHTIYQGDTLEVLKTFPDESVDCIVTSPPYYGLRDYGIEGQIGLESSLDAYLEKMLTITAELKRVLKSSGTMWWNHGDSYGTASGAGVRTGKQATNRGTQTNENWQRNGKPGVAGYEKSLLLQAHRLAIGMIDKQHWILRNAIIWHKPNCMPSSVKDRFTVDYEPVFFFTKSKEYWFEQQFEPYTAPLNRWGGATLVDKGNGRWDQGTGQNAYRDRAMRPCALGRTKRCIWRIPTKSSGGLHFATFPPVLIETPIKAGCPKQICNHCGKARKPIFSGSSHQAFNIRVRDVQAGRQKHLDRVASEKEVRQYREGSSHVGEGRKFVGYSDCGCGAGWHPGIVLDPFMGSGTTAEVAQRLGRNWIGIELNPEYVRLAKLRLSKVSLPTVRSHVDELHHWPTANGTVGDDNHRQAPDCYRFRSPESEN